MYFPLQNTCMTATVHDRKPIRRLVYGFKSEISSAGHRQRRHDRGDLGRDGQDGWKHEQRAGMMSLMATAGGLLFGGDTNGHFRAFDQKTGAVLWDVNLGSPVTGYPATFAVDGKQYVAVSTGTSLVALVSRRLTPELQHSGAGQLFVFALP